MKRLLLGLSLLVFGACATSSKVPSPAAPVPSTDPLAALRAREVAAMPTHTVGDDAAFFSAQVEGKQAPVLTVQGGLRQLVVDMGTEQPLRCFIYPKAINLAQTLRLFVTSVSTHVDKHQIDRIDAGQVAGQPYLSLVTSYSVEAGPERGAGQVKYVASRGENTTTLCMHDEPGYLQTFERVTSGLLATLHFTADESDPARKLLIWRTLAVQTAGDAHIGVVENRLYEGEAGYAFASSRSLLEIAPDGSLVASDEAENQFSNAQGDVLEGKYVKITNDAVAYNLGLSRDGKQSYQVDGSVRGEAFQKRLQIEAPLPDFATRSANLRKLCAGKDPGVALKWLVFVPDAPEQFTGVEFQRAAPPGAARAGVLLQGNQRSAVELDEKGMQKRLQTSGGSVERVWQNSAEGQS